MIKVVLKYLSFVCLLIYISKAKGQLPYFANNLCLDQMQQFGDTIKPSNNMVITDFNKDTYLDFAIIDVNLKEIKVYKSLGFGAGYAPYTTIALTTVVGVNNSITSGDYNNDTYNDIAVCYGGNIKVFANNGSPTFSLSYILPISTSYVTEPTYIQTSDFDKDGKEDIVLVTANITTNNGVAVLCFKNTTTSNITFNLDYQNLIFYGLQSLSINSNVDFAVGDINGDLRPDIAITYSNKKDSIAILTNTTTSTINFSVTKLAVTPGAFTSLYTPLQCAMGDLNNDGIKDLVTYSSSTVVSDLVSIYIGTLANLIYITSFTIPNTFSISGQLKDFKLNDINDDGNIDFVGITASELLIYLHNGTNFAYTPSLPIIIGLPANTAQSEEMQIADFDNNGLNDIFIKTLKGNRAKPVVIPNFSYKNYIYAIGTAICNTQAATLNAVSITSVSPLLNPNYDWYNTTNPSLLFSGTTYTTLTQNNYFYKLKFPFPYTSGAACFLNSDTVNVSVTAGPSISITPFTSTTVCYNATINVLASGADTYTWSSGGNINSQTFTTTANNTTTYLVSGTDSDGCVGTNTLTINLFPLNTNAINSTKNPVCIGDSVTLTFPSTTSYTWSSGNINNPFTTVYPTSNSTYSLTYIYGNNCISYKTIDINIDPLCATTSTMVYNSITPNGDGLNDAFFIENIENFPKNRVTIYNRWGQQIKQINGYNNVTKFWPSKDEVANLISTTYFYLIDYGNGTIVKNWIEIISN